jgi:hypothetical protein
VPAEQSQPAVGEGRRIDAMPPEFAPKKRKVESVERRRDRGEIVSSQSSVLRHIHGVQKSGICDL